MSLEEKKQEIVDEFSLYDEWLDKYEYLIELGKSLEPFPEEKKTEGRLIKGCQSRVWLDAEERDGHLYFKADRDAIITKVKCNNMGTTVSPFNIYAALMGVEFDPKKLDESSRRYLIKKISMEF